MAIDLIGYDRQAKNPCRYDLANVNAERYAQR
jgi:hypothetical protein